MTDQTLMNNYLMILKSTVEVYVHGTIESSNNDTRELLQNHLNNTLISQNDTYSLMTEYGFYQVNNVASSVINETYNKVSSQG